MFSLLLWDSPVVFFAPQMGTIPTGAIGAALAESPDTGVHLGGFSLRKHSKSGGLYCQLGQLTEELMWLTKDHKSECSKNSFYSSSVSTHRVNPNASRE